MTTLRVRTQMGSWLVFSVLACVASRQARAETPDRSDPFRAAAVGGIETAFFQNGEPLDLAAFGLGTLGAAVRPGSRADIRLGYESFGSTNEMAQQNSYWNGTAFVPFQQISTFTERRTSIGSAPAMGYYAFNNLSSVSDLPGQPAIVDARWNDGGASSYALRVGGSTKSETYENQTQYSADAPPYYTANDLTSTYRWNAVWPRFSYTYRGTDLMQGFAVDAYLQDSPVPTVGGFRQLSAAYGLGGTAGGVQIGGQLRGRAWTMSHPIASATSRTLVDPSVTLAVAIPGSHVQFGFGTSLDSITETGRFPFVITSSSLRAKFRAADADHWGFAGGMKADLHTLSAGAGGRYVSASARGGAGFEGPGGSLGIEARALERGLNGYEYFDVSDGFHFGTGNTDYRPVSEVALGGEIAVIEGLRLRGGLVRRMIPTRIVSMSATDQWETRSGTGFTGGASWENGNVRVAFDASYMKQTVLSGGLYYYSEIHAYPGSVETQSQSELVAHLGTTFFW